MATYISSIGIANPEFSFPQMEIAGFMANAVNMNGEERKRLFALYKASGITNRYSVIPDFGKEKGDYTFFPNTADMEPFPSVSERMKVFEKKALPLALDAIDNCLKDAAFDKKDITHLITVSCTGMYAPGIDLEIVDRLQLRKNIERTCINYMGCYAAFNALKVSNAICTADPDANVMIVCVELCTIHYQKNKNWDHLLSNAIFGDGAAAVLVQGKKPLAHTSLSLESFFCDIAIEGRNDMAWHISDFGFEMTLSSYIPDMIKGGIKKLTKNLLNNIQLDPQDIDLYAIHPGGKRILEVIEEELQLPKEKNKYAYEVLKNYGNMSSPTVLFVLYYILKALKQEDHQKNILGFAFGPGLTLESMLLKVNCPEKPEKKFASAEEKEIAL